MIGSLYFFLLAFPLVAPVADRTERVEETDIHQHRVHRQTLPRLGTVVLNIFSLKLSVTASAFAFVKCSDGGGRLPDAVLVSTELVAAVDQVS